MIDRLEGQSDAQLLELSIAGDENAFLMLYECLKPSLFRYAFDMTNSKTAAEEVTQEVFISLLTDAHRYRKTQGNVAAFAFGIARNLIRRLQRRERVYQWLPSDEVFKKLSFSENGTEELSAQAIRNQRIERLPDSANTYIEAILINKDGSRKAWAFARIEVQCFTTS